MRADGYDLQFVIFYGSDIPTANVDGKVYIVMKPVVEALGLSWRRQQRKLQDQRWGLMALPFATNGGVQTMLCIPITRLNGWLFSINPAKVKAELRDNILRYQEECVFALYDYWMGGGASLKRAALHQTSSSDIQSTPETAIAYQCLQRLETLSQEFLTAIADARDAGIRVNWHWDASYLAPKLAATKTLDFGPNMALP